MVRVVVVEDEHHLRRELVLTTPWEQLGCTVVGEASNGREALDVILRTRPDLVLADIRMPGMDGIRLLSEVRSRLPGNETPAAVFISGHDEFEYARSALRLGAEDYLLKPIDDDELHRVVRTVIERRDSEERERQERASQDLTRKTNDLLPESRERPYANRYVEEAVEYLARHLHEDIGLADVAEQLRISESYLSRLFSEGTGYTLNEYLTRLRIRTAVDLLRDPHLRIKEVMARCGYHDASYFGQVFRRLVGATPSSFRRQYDCLRDGRSETGPSRSNPREVDPKAPDEVRRSL